MEKKEQEDSGAKFRFALHEYFQPFLLSVIGALVGTVLWFCVKVYDKVDVMDANLNSAMMQLQDLKATQSAFTDFKDEFKEADKIQQNDIKNIEIALAKINVSIPNVGNN